MKDSDRQLDRLLRSAAEAQNLAPNEMPFGFDTRVLAHWRAGKPDLIDLRRLLRRVVFLSLAVIALSSAGIYSELRQGDDLATGPLTDEYAIADSAIGSTFEP